jgi:hypothetical protein
MVRWGYFSRYDYVVSSGTMAFWFYYTPLFLGFFGFAPLAGFCLRVISFSAFSFRVCKKSLRLLADL